LLGHPLVDALVVVLDELGDGCGVVEVKGRETGVEDEGTGRRGMDRKSTSEVERRSSMVTALSRSPMAEPLSRSACSDPASKALRKAKE
jgi:hypothetical protein